MTPVTVGFAYITTLPAYIWNQQAAETHNMLVYEGRFNWTVLGYVSFLFYILSSFCKQLFNHWICLSKCYFIGPLIFKQFHSKKNQVLDKRCKNPGLKVSLLLAFDTLFDILYSLEFLDNLKESY